MEFLQSYGKVLGFDPAKDVPSLCMLQEGLLGVGDSAGEVQDLLVRLLQAALYDPGLPPYCQVSGCVPVPVPASPVTRRQQGSWCPRGSCAVLREVLSLLQPPLPLPVPLQFPTSSWGTPGLAPSQAWVFPAQLLVSLFFCLFFFPFLLTPPRSLTPLLAPQSLKILGEKVSEISLNRDTVSEVLRCFLTAYGAEDELCEGLRTKPFQALPPDKKAAILAFLVNELNSSTLIIK